MISTERQQVAETVRNHLIVMGILILALVMRSCGLEDASTVRDRGREHFPLGISTPNGQG